MPAFNLTAIKIEIVAELEKPVPGKLEVIVGPMRSN